MTNKQPQPSPPEAEAYTPPVSVIKPPIKVPLFVGALLAALAGGFLGAWLLLNSGLVSIDAAQTITDNRQHIVEQEGDTLAAVFAKVDPSTVAITTQGVTRAESLFFGSQQRVVAGAGSGVIVSKDGYILTNKHVVPEGTTQVTVVLNNGKEYKNVKVVGRDPSNDIAFIKIEGVNDLTPATLGDSSTVQPGQKVVAIGNALGIFRNSVSSGIISGIGRPIQASDGQGGTPESLENLLQTDAAINHGNSGGPLVNLLGEVIGINTAISEEGQAIGFAIPINDAKGLVNTVVKTGKVSKPYLGVRYVTLDPQVAEELNLPVSEGALIRAGGGSPGVVAGSPAAKANVREGDIITKVNGKQLSATAGLASSLAQFSVGDEVTLMVLRDGREQSVKVKLEAFPES